MTFIESFVVGIYAMGGLLALLVIACWAATILVSLLAPIFENHMKWYYRVLCWLYVWVSISLVIYLGGRDWQFIMHLCHKKIMGLFV